MPELAEVAIYAHDLTKWFRSRRRAITGIKLPNRNDGGSIVIPRPAQSLVRELVGQRVMFFSEGKALHLAVACGDSKPILEVRLGMTGAFTLKKPVGRWKRHCFLEIETGNGSVFYVDHRRFGRFKVPTTDLQSMAIGGYSFQRGFWTTKEPSPPSGFDRRSRVSWLLGYGDSTGVGNYMANEALGRANLSPFDTCTDEKEAKKILALCGKIAKESFALGGNSFGTGYFRLTGEEGRYIRKCRFYRNPEIPKILVGGRPVFSTFSSPPD